MVKQTSIFDLPFHDLDEDVLKTDLVTIVVQVNCKVRANIDMPAGSTQEQVEDLARQDATVQRWIASKRIVKAVHVKDKLVSFVVS